MTEQTQSPDARPAAGSPAPDDADVVVIGGGHNGLVAATLLARAGHSVTVLERADHVGGATVSEEVFPGARISRDSYLVSLFPQELLDELGLELELVPRRYSSYTPVPGTSDGLLVDNHDARATRASFDTIGDADDAARFADFHARTSTLAEALWPTMMGPLPRRAEARALVAALPGGAGVWEDFVERPLGEVVERSVGSDLARGVVLTDALIGTFAGAHDPSLEQNRCFLYHVIGRGTGAWDVPRGGMGRLADGLADAAREAGARIVVSAEVTAVSPGGRVAYRGPGGTAELRAGRILANVAPAALARLVAADGDSPDGDSAAGGSADADAAPSARSAAAFAAVPEGAQAKVNLLLTRLPRLRDFAAPPEIAFSGTFHVNEGYAHLEAARAAAAAGRIPEPLPLETYCHSLSDPSILAPELRRDGHHTMTVFTLHTPHRLLAGRDPGEYRAQLQAAVLRSLNSVLAEPIEGCIATGPDGAPCIETRTTADLEDSLGMPGGNIFHGPLSWPFAEDDEPLETSAARWGVETPWERVLLCGAGSRRGGGVSGLGGWAAARAILDAEPGPTGPGAEPGAGRPGR
ncbi:phytoene desaturase family protein [Arthrobacter halodurans]|uniref:Pyridine nucleotide-disulfide oxidoreductase domain-containing protein 2 n=1 Tax=Arthrobacter halodurans TaxID=516699 RepID=A0ABV4UN05_9MICC